MRDGLEQVTLKKKWGKHSSGDVIWVDPVRAVNLIDNNFAVAGDVKTAKKKRKESNDS